MQRTRTAQRIALISIGISAGLSALKIAIGNMAGSTAVVADGLEAAGDVVASAVVLFGLTVAARPPDEDHPYGHGRIETLSGFTVGMMLALAGAGIALNSFRHIYAPHAPPLAYAVWPLLISIAIKTMLSIWKFRTAKSIRSDGLKADAWNDTVDILSGVVALIAVSVTLYDPQRFGVADAIGGCGVGGIIIFLGLRVVRETTLQLMDTMPDPALLAEVRSIAESVPGARKVEKCFARKTGLQYHVDLHLEVDPELTVRQSHAIAGEVRTRLKAQLEWVADVLVHVEPNE